MIKKYVLDTNVLLLDPEALFKFEENEVIIPITVIEELDAMKKDDRETQKEVCRNARQVTRYLDEYLENGDIRKGIVINEQGGILRTDIRYRIEEHNVDLPLDYSKNDNKIINCAWLNDAIIVSRDTNLRIIASAYNVPIQNYKNDRIEVDDYYTGWVEKIVTPEFIELIYAEKFISAEGWSDDLYPNQFILFKNICNEKSTALAEYDSVMNEFRLLVTDQAIMGISGRNMEQHFALSALCDPEIKVVTLLGKAGCGKSLLAIAAGLNGATQGTKDYKKLLVYRPVVPMGNDIGYLPGSMEEKLGPWMQAISDNIEFIMGETNAEDRPRIKKPRNNGSVTKNDIPIMSKEKDAGKVSQTVELQQQGYLELNALTYIRGRSIPNQYIVIDEAQNLSIHEIKTILTRAGEGTKIVLTGDPSQIDCPWLDATNNGLSYVAERFKDQKIAAHIKFSKSERSELAEIAANIL